MTEAAILDGRRADGFLARLDDRVRVVIAIASLVVLAWSTGITTLVCANVLGLALLAEAKMPIRTTLRRLARAELFVLALILTLPFTVSGATAFAVLGLSASYDGLLLAAIVGLRVQAALLLVMALLMPMGAFRLALALQAIGFPAKLATLILLTARYIEVFGGELGRIRRAMRARGFVADFSMRSWKALAYLVVTLVIRASERAERVGWALKARRFSGTLPGAPRRALSAMDYGIAAACGIALSMLAVLEAFG